MSLVYYDKATAIEDSIKNNTLVCNRNIVEYFTTKNYNSFLKIIKNNKNKKKLAIKYIKECIKIPKRRGPSGDRTRDRFHPKEESYH